MRSPERTREAIKHLYAAREGALKACAPPKSGVIVETADDKAKRHYEDLRDENKVRVILLGRMIDLLQWSLEEPSEFSEWMYRFDLEDRVEKEGFAARIA